MLQYVDMFTEKHLLRFVITKRSFRYHSPVFVLQFTNPVWINFGLGVVCCFLCRRWHRCILQESSMSLHWWWRTFMTAHTHTRLTALFPGLPGWAGTRKVKPIWILLKQETVSGSDISWAICKSAPRSIQITMPAPHRSVFYRPDKPFRPPNQQRQSTEGKKQWARSWLRNQKYRQWRNKGGKGGWCPWRSRRGGAKQPHQK